VLNRARYRGESFVIERNGEAVAVIEPAGMTQGANRESLASALSDLEWPDEDFARDLERVHAEQPKAEPYEWPD
jgi:hypothetical protein